jgi:dihydroneopterin aldolase
MPLDRIQLEGMVFYGYHGVGPEEQSLGQRFVVDIEVEKDLRTAGATDEISDTVNYSELYRTVKEIVEGPSRKLLENVAETISRQVLLKFDVEAVRVKVKKPEVPMKGSILKHASVEIFRERDGL